MLVFLLYMFVFLLILIMGIVIFPCFGVSAIKLSICQWKNPRRLKWHNEIIDIVTTFIVGIVQILLGLLFLFIGYQILIEMINKF